MRMWNVPTEMMCRKHLLGEHVELHMFVGALNKNRNIQGHVDKGQVEIHNIKKRHKELVEEMKKRGYKHNSPLPDFKVFEKGKVNVEENIIELKKRCKECKNEK